MKKKFVVGCGLMMMTFFGGCSSIFRSDIAPSSGSAWVPPAKEILSKNKQIEKVADTGAVVSFGDGLDLPTLLNIAFENSPATKKSWQAAKVAAAQSGKALSPFFPKITVSGVMSRAEVNTPASKNLATNFYPAVELQCSLFKFGGHIKSAEAARQMLYAANYQHNRALQSLAHEVQMRYFLLDSAENAVEAGQKNLEDAIVMYDAAFVKYESGISNIQDYLQAKANKSRAEFEIENARSLVESSRASLASTIGVTVSNDVKIMKGGGEADIKDLDISIDELIAETLKTRQDILAKHSAVQAKHSAMWSSTAKNLPELVVGGSCDRKKYHRHSGHFDNFSIYAALNWTVFDGFSSLYDAIEARESWKLAQQELRHTELLVSAEIWSKYHAFKSAIKQLRAARNYEQAAQESFDSMILSYKNGLSSFSDLMSSQSQLAAARQQAVISKNTLSLAVVDLAYVTGAMNFGGTDDVKK